MLSIRIKKIYFAFFLIMVFFLIPMNSYADENGVSDYDYYIKNLEDKVLYALQDIEIKGSHFETASESVEAKTGSYKGREDALVWSSDVGTVDYQVEIPEDGLYGINIEYLPLKGLNDTIVRGIMIDGAYPFKEADSFNLSRSFEIEYPFEYDEMGNNLRPRQQQIFEWRFETLQSHLGFHTDPLMFYLSKGTHKISLIGVRGGLAISSINFTKPQDTPSYNDYIKKYDSIPKYDGPLIIKEAEDIYRNSSTSISVLNMNEAGLSPEANGRIIYNVMGGARWRGPGQWSSWEISVPEDGLYKVAYKYLQSYKTNLISYRKIEIDDQVPFQELGECAFTYSTKWQNKVLSDAEGNPYMIYLTAGTHTIKMTVNSAPYNEVIKKAKAVVEKLNGIEESVKKTTGIINNSVDRYRDWNIKETLPEIGEELLWCIKSTEDLIVELKNISGSDSNVYDVYTYSINMLEKFLENPDIIPNKLDILEQIQMEMISYTQRLGEEPLLIDMVYLSDPASKLPNSKPGFFRSVIYFFRNFFKTFSPNFGITGKSEKDAIEVWVQRSRDNVNLMQEMCDYDFTPETGIKVNINFVPDGQLDGSSNQLLYLSNAAGNSPDIACGVALGLPFDFALRNALVDLNKYPDYDQVKQRFVPGSLISFHYDKGDYALPETMTFNMMFYRTDIFGELDIEPPNTWNDVKYILPTLEQNGYKFYYPRSEFLTFYYQNGLDIYSSDGMKLNINSPTGYDVFNQWIELYRVYGMPREVMSFYQHFRLGDIPVGIVPIHEYPALVLAAPDITGKWDILPIPGITSSDGIIERWQGGRVQGTIIFKSTEKQDECWEFLKWWTSTEVQSNFANDLEALYGLAFRWYTANREAFRSIPWSGSELDSLMDQYDWFKEIPYVPGSYFTAREIDNAWNRVILEKKVGREEYEIAMERIEREINRKLQEFGFIDDMGNVIKILDILEVPKPE